MRYYPERGPRQRSWPARNRAEQKRFREAVLERAGEQCEHRDDPTDASTRCTVTGAANLQAHHLEPGNPDPTTGMALCQSHHREMDHHAR